MFFFAILDRVLTKNEEHITILISTYILCNCLYKPVAGGHFGPSSSGGLGALPLGACFGFQI